ncbi:MAG: cupin domain-containing protein [Deltaproteobacteria bacterium]|nr:cupin domain-containing protein [Deltaproteobacteria bacterium]
MDFSAKQLSEASVCIAPDGLKVELQRGGMACFELAPERVSVAVAHKTVEEIWLFLAGEGEMWRKQGEREETIAVKRGLCLTIPVGVSFQVRCLSGEPLVAVGVTMPHWPGDEEAYEVEGKWKPL